MIEGYLKSTFYSFYDACREILSIKAPASKEDQQLALIIKNFQESVAFQKPVEKVEKPANPLMPKKITVIVEKQTYSLVEVHQQSTMTILALTSVAAATLGLSQIAGEVSRYGIGLNRIANKPGIREGAAVLNDFIVYSYQLISRIVGFDQYKTNAFKLQDVEKIKIANMIDLVAIHPVIVELVCRGLVQQCLLREIPKTILHYIAPNQAHLVDAKIVKVARVATSALLYAAASSTHLENVKGGGLPQLVGGISAGIMMECGQFHIWEVIYTHALTNLFYAILFPA